MAAKTKAKIASIGQVLGKKAKEFTFIDPPLIDAPFTTINKLNESPRQLPDPSKTLKPAMGVERIMFNSLQEVEDEKGPNGERVYRVNQEETRIRFVGDWTIGDVVQNGVRVRTNDTSGDSYFEITFVGTGLNLMSTPNVLWGEVFVDGASIGTPTTTPGSTVLNTRNYRINSVFPQVSGLAYGVHTVRVLGSAIGGGSLAYGCEILNEGAQIQAPQGEVFAAGNKLSKSALTTLDYNTGFDGSPGLNGKGGRVSVYLTPEGEIKKAIQQADTNQANLDLADHSNEEVIRKVNFREFGANRGDDFSTLAGVGSDRVFILDDGTTSLVGDNVIVDTTENGLEMNNAGFYTLTFMGTGLDVKAVQSAGSGSTTGIEVFVDGNSIGEIPAADQDSNKIIKVVSGLPYGIHTIKFDRNAGTEFLTVSDFIIYGPKKPEIPADAQELSEYYLMADFVANTTQNVSTVSDGVLRKDCTRELLYVEGTGGSFDWVVSSIGPDNLVSGLTLTTDRQNAYFEYTFFGTGFDLRWQGFTDRAQNCEVTIDGTPLTVANFPSASFSTYGAGTGYNDTTGVLDQRTGSALSGCGFVCEGLPLGIHTVRFNNGTASETLIVDALDVITPIHYPNTKVGNLGMSPGIQLQKETSLGEVDLSKAKAWLLFDQANNEILASKNISAVVDTALGTHFIYFERPFKTANYITVAAAEEPGGGTNPVGMGIRNKKAHSFQVDVFNVGGPNSEDNIINIACFGELTDEESE